MAMQVTAVGDEILVLAGLPYGYAQTLTRTNKKAAVVMYTDSDYALDEPLYIVHHLRSLITDNVTSL
jgi:hypothetical protein